MLFDEMMREIKMRFGKSCLSEDLNLSLSSFLVKRPAYLRYSLYMARACSGRRDSRSEWSMKA